MRSPTSWNDLLRPGQATDFFARREMPPFEPAARGYSPANALWLAELSRLVYRQDLEEVADPSTPTRRQFLAKGRLSQKAFFLSPETDTQAMLVEREVDPRFAVLVFRGTEQKLKDFITDLRFGVDTLAGNDYAIHEGFRQALESVWPQIESTIDGLAPPLFYCGHSLGAALATLAAEKRKPRALYTFGSPRVGNGTFAATLDGLPVYRVVNDRDLVTTVPPEAFGFEHVGVLTKLIEPARGFSFNPIEWLRLAFSPAKPLADHAPVNYVDRL